MDKREFTGPIYKQIENAVEFVLRNIRLGATIDGLVRRESYELPVEAIREMIINAHCHRNWLDDSCIQVAVYDNRLEVTSPGGLYNGLTYEELMSGHSKIRNKAIANIFSQMGLVEAWGSGMQRILNGAADYELPVPEVEVFDNMFRVNLFRKKINYTSELNFNDSMVNDKVNDKVNDLLDILIVNPNYTVTELANIFKVSRKTIAARLKELKEKGLIERVGSARKGYWKINSSRE